MTHKISRHTLVVTIASLFCFLLWGTIVRDLMVKPVPQQVTHSSLVRPQLPAGDSWTYLVTFRGEITTASVAIVEDAIAAGEKAGVERLVLELDSMGGEVEAGFEFAKAIERTKLPTVCVVDGFAKSMGFFVLQACHVRVMTQRSVLMVHDPLYPDGVTARTEVELRNLADDLRETANIMLDFESRQLKVSRAELAEKTRNNRNWVMGAIEAQAVGAVDGVVGSVESTVLEVQRYRAGE